MIGLFWYTLRISYLLIWKLFLSEFITNFEIENGVNPTRTSVVSQNETGGHSQVKQQIWAGVNFLFNDQDSRPLFGPALKEVRSAPPNAQCADSCGPESSSTPHDATEAHVKCLFAAASGWGEARCSRR